AITNKFISDPREVVKAGDIVKVKVIEVDVARKRISFTMRLNDEITSQDTQAKSRPSTQKSAAPKQHNRSAKPKKDLGNAAMGNAFAEAFAKMKK
ncbi:RNA-binding transcriptional accessory protein, partial [Pseudoalteromonas ruthenica]